MVYAFCTRLNTAIEVERARAIHANLKSIFILLEVEQSQVCRAEKNKNLRLPNKPNFDRFLLEGIGYLRMAKNFNSWILPNGKKSRILRNILNTLGRVRFQYKRMIRMRELLLAGIIDNRIREDIVFGLDNVFQVTDQLRTDSTVGEYDLDEYEVIEFYDWQSERKTRTYLLNKINLLIDKINYAIIKRYLTLYSTLQKYCKKATQFLRNNRKILQSSNLRKRNSCCKYHFLKQLIACCHHVLSLNQLNDGKD
ncbi:PREDICTED: uncharacterized protein LOC105455718 [Wasmannia auropunctata]|uniref:uncharacterized protein LOC105455718 n=1 Tax=Wasmannia auropunctata TaxID=64793 RepID=UPI0005F01643|nr:PREDICTED: uncharacterized protein LOC105455718 [Wasmannia auropunctata]